MPNPSAPTSTPPTRDQCRADRDVLGQDPVLCNTFPSWNADVANGEFAFRWPAQTFDSTWSIEVYKNDDTTGSIGQPGVLQNISKQSPRPSRPRSGPVCHAVPLADQAHRRLRQPRGMVRLRQVLGRPSPVTPAQPSRRQRAAAERPDADVAGLRRTRKARRTTTPWTSATRHQRQRGFRTARPAPPRSRRRSSYPTGTYSWVVTAYDASGNILGTSPNGASAWTFTVDTSSTVVTPTEIQAPDGAQVAKVLTSTPPTWGQPGVANTYQWLRSGANISGATGTTYTIVAADVGKQIALKVTGKKPGYTDTVSISTSADCRTRRCGHPRRAP